MTCPLITLYLLINENDMKIMLNKYLRLYFQVQNQPPIASMKVLRIIVTQEDKSHQDNLSRMLLRTTIPW